MCFFVLQLLVSSLVFFFFFNDTATTEIYTLSLHDALPICFHAFGNHRRVGVEHAVDHTFDKSIVRCRNVAHQRSEEHTSELQSQSNLVCRLLLEKKKKRSKATSTPIIPDVRPSISADH